VDAVERIDATYDVFNDLGICCAVYEDGRLYVVDHVTRDNDTVADGSKHNAFAAQGLAP
jgi:hypothetical protein